MQARLGYNFKGPKILFGELLGGSSGAEEFGSDEGVISNFEVRSRSSSDISGVFMLMSRGSEEIRRVLQSKEEASESRAGSVGGKMPAIPESRLVQNFCGLELA